MQCYNFWCDSKETCDNLSKDSNLIWIVKDCPLRKSFNRFETWLKKRAFHNTEFIGLFSEVWDKWQEEKEKVK